MSNRIEITVDDGLMKLIEEQARKMDLSVSSFSRLVLENTLHPKSMEPLMAQAIVDIEAGRVESLSLSDL